MAHPEVKSKLQQQLLAGSNRGTDWGVAWGKGGDGEGYFSLGIKKYLLGVPGWLSQAPALGSGHDSGIEPLPAPLPTCALSVE